MSITREQAQSAISCLLAVADAIRDAGEIPAGTIYAALAQNGCTFKNFETMVDLLTRGESPLIVKRGDLLVWNGPKE